MNSNTELSQDVAKTLFLEGATLVILNMPLEIEFGIDLKSWHTGKNFRGVKMIPPGIHIVYYNGSNKYGDVAPRISFFHNFKKKEFLVRKWDPESEELTNSGVSEEEIERLKDNLLNLDPFLGTYPYDIYEKWKKLSSHITESLLERIVPESGVVRAALELVRDEAGSSQNKKEEECNDQDQVNTPGQEANHEVNQSSPSSQVPVATSQTTNPQRRRRRQEEGNWLLPELRPKPGTEPRFTPVPDSPLLPVGASPSEVTRHSLDLTFTLDHLISLMKNAEEVLGEVELSFVCFLVGLSLESLDIWRRLLWVVCRSEKAMTKRSPLYASLLPILETQLTHIPEDFLVDIVSSENVLYLSLRELFRAMLTCSEIYGRLRCDAMRFRQRLVEKFGWDFSNLDQDDDDDAPTVVVLEDVPA